MSVSDQNCESTITFTLRIAVVNKQHGFVERKFSHEHGWQDANIQNPPDIQEAWLQRVVDEVVRRSKQALEEHSVETSFDPPPDGAISLPELIAFGSKLKEIEEHWGALA